MWDIIELFICWKDRSLSLCMEYNIELMNTVASLGVVHPKLRIFHDMSYIALKADVVRGLFV